MTAEKIFDLVMGLMYSDKTEKSDYETIFYPTMNMIVAECFDVNNILRRKKGLEPIERIPYIEKESDQITYEEELTRTVIPYGIAANLYSEDDENGISNIYREKYYLLMREIGFADFREAIE